MTDIPREDIAWSKWHFEMMSNAGVWGVPRSGLVFQKREHKLVLIAQMPWSDELPMTNEELVEYQEVDYNCIKARFEAAGIEVERDEELIGRD